jgi:CheY-like chemotaxis protein
MSPPARGMTVLVVDDELAMRALTRRMLEGEGYQVREAADGMGALEALAEGLPVDVIVTDIRMPRMDGRELASRLVARSPRIPIVFMSGYDVYLGPLDLPGPVLAKPFRSEQLTALVSQLLAGQVRLPAMPSPPNGGTCGNKIDVHISQEAGAETGIPGAAEGGEGRQIS